MAVQMAMMPRCSLFLVIFNAIVFHVSMTMVILTYFMGVSNTTVTMGRQLVSVIAHVVVAITARVTGPRMSVQPNASTMTSRMRMSG